ncbi:MAG: bifunctional (p)ppGpp synthetase/guanosine-3',5'-bis(diphosphate) 3'-pyrophosphohydrolase [Bacteroidales bacterium]|nr:bifunctional (p)ppGpp synthetase/guanosine-3',5'-bis(diphosphate) 3'-pyrophosphohydrolase [Bacteroidales bacterium]
MNNTLPDNYSSEEKEEILRRYERLLTVWQTRKEKQDLEMVEKAFYFAANAHCNQRRRTGEPYIYHPIAVATIAAEDIGLGRTSITCALLHDVVEDTDYTLDDISNMFGEKVAHIIDGLTKLDKVENAESMQAENFKKIISSLSYDIRVVLIKLADRLHNMRTLSSMPPHKQLKIASETSYIYAPLAYRLGLHSIKNELEDLSLKYRDPVIYESINKQMNEVRAERTSQLREFLVPIQEAFNKRGIQVDTQIIERSTHSIWKRMQKKQLTFDDLYGNFNIRFIVDCPLDMEKIECWKIYAVITDVYTPNVSKLKDWISTPKINGYESIHAVFMSHDGKWVEVHIRSKRMNEIAEKGFTAYWSYRTDNQTESGFDEWLKRVNELISSESESTLDFVDTFTNDLFSDEIKVFTPQGKAITLPKHSTALDFAYSIHSEVGNHSIAAHVNNQLVQLDQKLNTGDQVEIITSEAQHPQEKWFEFLNTAFAKSKLKAGIKEYRRTFREKGEELFNGIMKKLDLEASKANAHKVMDEEHISSVVDFYYYIAQGKINEQLIQRVLKPQSSSGGGGFLRAITFGLLGNGDKRQQITENPLGEFDFNVATCCNPIPGDEVVAFNFPGEPLQIHRSNCAKAIEMMSHYGNNIVKAKWQPKSEIAFLAGVKITAIDNVGLLNKMTNLFSNELKLNLHSLQMESKQDIVEANISVYVHSTAELDLLMDQLSKMKEVKKVVRLI